MFPLISGIEEFRIARLLVREISDELRAEGHEIPDGIPLGAMVEVPSAAIMARELAREVDFMSIGTNDLIQYSLAVDRSNNLVADLYRPTSPAVLRLIAKVIAAGEAENTDVSMCGEMAADPLMVPVLVGLGLRSFSMNPQAVPVVRALIRQLSYREAGTDSAAGGEVRHRPGCRRVSSRTTCLPSRKNQNSGLVHSSGEDNIWK